MKTADPRRTPARDDLAAAKLKETVKAKAYADGLTARVVAAYTPLRRKPKPSSVLDTEALFGETVTVYEDRPDGWVWAQLDADDYVGYMPTAAIGPPDPAPTHLVTALRTYRYPEPDLKSPPGMLLSMGSTVTVAKEVENRGLAYAVLADGSAVAARHLAPIGTLASDFVAIAERFVGTPYLWGGKTSLGLDCSALVQIACSMAGITAPRDTPMQEAELGSAIADLPRGRLPPLERGDLVFWPGHVGIMVDGERLLHANGHHMETVIEPLAEAVKRMQAGDLGISSIRRIDS